MAETSALPPSTASHHNLTAPRWIMARFVMPSGIVPVSDVDRARLRRVPRSRLSELRHAAQWPLRLLYYADPRGGPAHLRIVPTAGEIVPESP